MERGEEGGPRPSSRSAERYAQGVRGEVGDLRATLRAALDEAEQHEAEGRPDLAVAALERQRAAVAQVHARLEQLTASAAVEREAEHVLQGASAQQSAAPTASPVAAADAPDAGPARPGPRRRRGLVAVVAGTLATAVAGAAVALTGGAADRAPSDPTVVAVAPVEVDDAPAPPANATSGTGTATSDGDADAAHTPTQADDAASGEQDAATRADREQDTPRRGLDALVAQVVESLSALLGDGADRDAPAVPSTDELDQRVPAVPEVTSSPEDDGAGSTVESGRDDDDRDDRDLEDLR